MEETASALPAVREACKPGQQLRRVVRSTNYLRGLGGLLLRLLGTMHYILHRWQGTTLTCPSYARVCDCYCDFYCVCDCRFCCSSACQGQSDRNKGETRKNLRLLSERLLLYDRLRSLRDRDRDLESG